MKSSTGSFLVNAGPLLLVLFIDGMGLGLVIPILNELIFGAGSSLFIHGSISPAMHNMIYGLTIGIFMFCWFFGAAILGDLSDRIGRKKSLIICLLGAFLSYVISAISVLSHSLTLLILGRVIAGFTSGSQPIAQAAIIDLSSDADKARNIGLILLAISLGFILGPLFGGILADNRIVSWFDFTTPFYFAALVSFLNILLLLWLFHDTQPKPLGRFKIDFYQAIYIFTSAFSHPRIKKLSILYFIYIFGWSSFYSFIALFLIKRYGYSPTVVSLFMALMGAGFAFGTGVLVNYLTRRFSLRSNFIANTLLTGVLTLLMVVIPNSLASWILIAPLSTFIAVSYSCIVTLFSNEVEADKQGWVMGITGSIMAFVWGINGIIVGMLALWSANLPILLAAIVLALAAILTLFLYQESAMIVPSQRPPSIH